MPDSTSDTQKGLSYSDAGVNIDEGDRLVDAIKPLAKSTRRPGADAALGGFGGAFDLKAAGFKDPVLISGTDGVGTKLRIAIDTDKLDTVGIDLVAMCVNDLVVAGAEPLFFLDYYATGALNIDIAADVVTGIGRGCELAGCALVGGETAEMPGMYEGEDYDLAGFCVGVVEKSKIIDGSNVGPGDLLLGLPSSGPHSNGYSLIRKILEVSNANLQQDMAGQTLATALLAPTTIYVKSLLQLFAEVDVKALSHITGGGLLENLPRVLPDSCSANINTSSWAIPPVFQWLQEQGNVADAEMYRTFNCGVGMVICIAAADREQALSNLEASGQQAWVIGEITAGSNEVKLVP